MADTQGKRHFRRAQGKDSRASDSAKRPNAKKTESRTAGERVESLASGKSAKQQKPTTGGER
jgi:hypothetical protein